MPRVLFIAYTFPPIGGAGVQRTTKFVKYLGIGGWTASVVTVDGGSVPVWDKTLEAEVPPSIVVRRARTLEPSYASKAQARAGASTPSILSKAKSLVQSIGKAVLQPDAQVLWVPGAWRTARALLAETSHDAIIATGPPFSSFLMGAALARVTGLPLILDYRDEWSLSNQFYENRRPGRVAEAVQRHLEGWAVRRASVLLATTEKSAQALDEVAQRAKAQVTSTWIYNGYDPADFAHVVPEPKQEGRVRLVYTGTLWKLMSLEPLVRAVEQIAAEQPALASKLEIVIAGRRTPDQEALIAQLRELPCTVDDRPYLEHGQVLSLMASADALCLLLANLPGADRWVPAKTFEYMATGLPILAVIPDGELRALLREENAILASPSKHDEVHAALMGILTAERSQASAPRRCQSIHSRPNQAKQLAQLLNRLVGREESAGVHRTSTREIA